MDCMQLFKGTFLFWKMFDQEKENELSEQYERYFMLIVNVCIYKFYFYKI